MNIFIVILFFVITLQPNPLRRWTWQRGFLYEKSPKLESFSCKSFPNPCGSLIVTPFSFGYFLHFQVVLDMSIPTVGLRIPLGELLLIHVLEICSESALVSCVTSLGYRMALPGRRGRQIKLIMLYTCYIIPRFMVCGHDSGEQLFCNLPAKISDEIWDLLVFYTILNFSYHFLDTIRRSNTF